MKPPSYLETFLHDSPFFKRADLLTETDLSEQYMTRRAKGFSRLGRGVWDEVFEAFKKIEYGSDSLTCSTHSLNYSVAEGVLTIPTDVSSDSIRHLAKLLIPWRKGPFKVGAVDIDAEWRSNLKYERVLSHLGDINGARIADVGGGNGYYAFRLIDDGAGEVIVFDPSEKFFFQFEFLQRFARCPKVQLEMAGYEEAASLSASFDVVLCMGVLYHQKNPMRVLECCRKLLKRDGTILIESMVYDSEDSTCLFPEGRYAKARNVYFLPSVRALRAIIAKSGFEALHVVSIDQTKEEEQRTTEFMPFESLTNFLDPSNKNKTVEGYPAPIRAIIRARRRD